ncbi:hypothetical protein SDC9_62119 [bioreactor metagenome]|uniref:Uncharacterized protein n=1 Tax=bioreactor metagenome TaxID=1076179 RepID=A0A644XIH2_9ZZZZ
MKTIKAIFTKEKQNEPTGRAYSFNTELDVKVGDLLASNDYKGKYLQVVGVEDDVYGYFSYKTGELKKDMSSGCGLIKTLGDDTVIVDERVMETNYTGF